MWRFRPIQENIKYRQLYDILIKCALKINIKNDFITQISTKTYIRVFIITLSEYVLLKMY